MARAYACPYCGYEFYTLPNELAFKCQRCGALIRVVSGVIYKSEEIPPEISICITGILGGLLKDKEKPMRAFREFMEDFWRSQNLTKRQYDYLLKLYEKESRKGFNLEN